MAVGDSLGGQKADARLLDRALSAATEKGAQQFILVTPLGGGASAGGFLGNLFGGGGGSSKKPSKIEQQVPLCISPIQPKPDGPTCLGHSCMYKRLLQNSAMHASPTNSRTLLLSGSACTDKPSSKPDMNGKQHIWAVAHSCAFLHSSFTTP